LIRARSFLVGTLVLLCACGEPESPAIPGLQVEEWEAHPLSTDARFVSVRDMVLSGGFLWVLDGAPPFLTRISLETGEAIRLGRKGDGPGEFLDPWAVQPTADSSGILVWDFGAYRVTEFGLSGTHLSSMTMSQEGRILVRSNFREVSYADPFRVRSTPQGYLAGSFDRRLDLTADFPSGSIRLSSPHLDPGQDIVDLRDLLEPGLESMKEWAPIPFWDACGGSLVVWKPSTGEVVWFGADWTPQAQATFGLAPHEIEIQDVERYLERMARLELGPQYHTHEIDFAMMARRNRDRFATERPIVTDLRCQKTGTAWLRLFSTNTDPLGRGSDWILFGMDGPRHHVRTPAGFTPFLFTSEGHFGSSELLGGDQAIARLSPPSSPLFDPH